jgi:hypothetical protein
MRLLLVLMLIGGSAIAQTARESTATILNLSRVAAKDFQVGDRFEIVISGAAKQPVSVRTTMQGRTDWGPVIGWTGSDGRWSREGQFEKRDFGDWREVWTVGGKQVSPAIQFSLGAACLPGARSGMTASGQHRVFFCGSATFSTPSDGDFFHTPDGRIVPGRVRLNRTPEQYHAEIIEAVLTGNTGPHPRALGDEAGATILKMIGVNALSDDEVRTALSIIPDAFDSPKRIPEPQKKPVETLLLLQKLTDFTSDEELRQQIAGTVAHLEQH